MGRHAKKLTVEECNSISTVRLNKKGFFTGIKKGVMSWQDPSGQELGSIQFIISINPNDKYMRLMYTFTNQEMDGRNTMDYKVKLTSTPSHFIGDKKWWFICPLVKNSVPCLKRVGILYLVDKYFGCRHCHDLTYQSCRNSHQFERLFQYGYSPKEAKAYLKESQK